MGKLFDSADLDGDGNLNYNEIFDLLDDRLEDKSVMLPREIIGSYFQQIDSDRSGCIDYLEFYYWLYDNPTSDFAKVVEKVILGMMVESKIKVELRDWFDARRDEFM